MCYLQRRLCVRTRPACRHTLLLLRLVHDRAEHHPLERHDVTEDECDQHVERGTMIEAIGQIQVVIQVVNADKG